MKGSFFSLLEAHQQRQALEKELQRVKRINEVLMDRSEQQSSSQTAYSLFRTAASLEDKVKVRTAELSQTNHLLQEEIVERRRAQQALSQAKADAERANRNKTRFLSAVSHDLAQPLNAARLMLTALEEQLASPAQQNMVEHIAYSLRSMEQLLNSLVDISKLEANVMSAQRQVFALDPLLQQLFAEYALVAERKGLKLRYVATRMQVESDPDLLERILRNLLSNALRYTERGGVLLGCRRMGDRRLRIDVLDTGLGIPEDQQDTVFQEFQQAHSGHQAQGEKGLGLGLAIVHRIATLLEHPIGLSSQPGRGTQIHLSLPRVRRAPHLRTQALKSSSRPSFQGRRVALIDNDPLSMAGMRELLQHWGCEVSSAADSQALLAQVPDIEWDLLLVDYHLDAHRTGLEALADIDGQQPSLVPTVVVTADKTFQLPSHLERPQLHLLYKPVNPARLRALMGRLLISDDKSSAA